MSLADYLDRHGWDDDPLTLAADVRGGGSPSQLRLSQPSSPRKGAGSLDPLDFPFAARLSHANVLFNEEYGVPVPPGSRALSPLPNASPSPNRLRSSEPLGSSMRLSSCSPDFLRQNEALGSRLSSPSRQRSQSVGGSSWPSQASPPMPSGVRPPVPAVWATVQSFEPSPDGVSASDRFILLYSDRTQISLSKAELIDKLTTDADNERLMSDSRWELRSKIVSWRFTRALGRGPRATSWRARGNSAAAAARGP